MKRNKETKKEPVCPHITTSQLHQSQALCLPAAPQRNALCSMFGAMMKMTATAVKRLASESAKKTKLLYDSCVMVDFCELS